MPMLQQTFCHLPGVGVRAEREIWATGVHSWDAFARAAALQLPSYRREAMQRQLDESLRRLDAGDARHFGAALPSDQVWRLFQDFRHSIAYLDIETTGLRASSDHVTTIALYDGRHVRHYVHGQNLDAFAGDIREYQVLVTYNGKCFDVPFLRAALGVQLDQAHIDLRYVLRSLGHTGGLKGCERKLGLDRGDLHDVDGFFAVLLWNEFKRRRDENALETLLAYNIQDVLNLELLMVIAYNAKLKETPFVERLLLPTPEPAVNPFPVDRATVERLKRGSYGRMPVG